MGESTSYRESFSTSPEPIAIDTLPNDPDVLKELLRNQIEAFEALTQPLQHFHRLQALGTLAGGIAHEFNNILAAMLGFTEITQTLLPQDSPAQPNLKEVYTAGQRAREIIRQTLNYSRSATTVSQPLDYAPLVVEVISLLRASLPKTIEIREEIASDVGAVLADPASMHQILMNLCTNAAHALDNGGQIDIKVDVYQVDHALAARHSALQPGPYIRLRVEDNGHGISPEIIDRIFDPFYTTRAVAEGTGLGLAIVSRIVTTYHGALTVASTPGIGTTFTVYLPHATESPKASPQDSKQSPQGKGHILLVDDEAMLAKVGQHILERLGYGVDMRTSPTEALSLFCSDPARFDLLMTDLTMPDMSGVQLISIVRAIRPQVPVILCTGYGHMLDEEAVEALDVNALLIKPIETPDLAETLHRVLSRSASH